MHCTRFFSFPFFLCAMFLLKMVSWRDSTFINECRYLLSPWNQHNFIPTENKVEFFFLVFRRSPILQISKIKDWFQLGILVGIFIFPHYHTITYMQKYQFFSLFLDLDWVGWTKVFNNMHLNIQYACRTMFMVEVKRWNGISEMLILIMFENCKACFLQLLFPLGLIEKNT